MTQRWYGAASDIMTALNEVDNETTRIRVQAAELAASTDDLELVVARIRFTASYRFQ